MNTTVLAWIVGGIVLVGGAYLLVTHNTGKGDSMVKEEDHMMATSSDESMMKEGESTEQAGGDAMMKGDEGVMMSEKGSYESYAPEKLTLAEHGKVVLFFHADWCPICRPLDAAFKAGGIPDGVHVLKVDYDTATDLKKKYGVTYQHTFVQVDAQGKLITKFGDALTEADVFAKLK